MSFQRRSARAILLNSRGHMLLIHFQIARGGKLFAFWATPGGTVEPGESDREAATREVREELGIDVALTGPIHEVADRFEHDGRWVENIDVFFVGRCDSDAVMLIGTTATEIAAMQQTRWWSVDEIALSTETIFPEGLDEVIRPIL